MDYIKLFESYTSQKELEQLSKNILDIISEKTYDKFPNNIYYYEHVNLNDVNLNNYTILKDFIRDFGDMIISIVSNDDIEGYAMNGNGSYVISSDKNKYIFIKIKNYTLEKINRELNLDFDKKLYKDDLYTVKYYTNDDYSDTLIHELQHAYDDWRSGGKAINVSNVYMKNEDIYKDLTSVDIGQLKDEELKFIGKHHTEYLKLKHEIDARFTAAIKKTDFYDLDFELSIDNNVDTYVINPFKDVLRKFKNNMYPFVVLSDYDKKRVLRKFGQFYELEKEFVKELNKKQKPYK